MSSENEREAAASLVLGVRGILKDALFDLEEHLGDHEDAKDTADRLIAEYGLEPFILGTGQVGLHFMELGYSLVDDDDNTLIEQVRQQIEGCRNRDGEIDGVDERAHLAAWRKTLAEAIAEIDVALSPKAL